MQEAQTELQAGFASGMNVQAAIDRYNGRIAAIRQTFIQSRIPEYQAARDIQQMGNFASEQTPVGPTSARHSHNETRTYRAPERMNYAEIHLNEVSRYGDASSSVSVSNDEKTVSVNLNARSLRGTGVGKSRIEVSPVVIWEYDDAGNIAAGEWQSTVGPALGAISNG
jgi:hypothetical protein